MLCQSWGGTVRVFPAVPAAWADLVVHNFRTQGAFPLSAVREGGRVRWVRLTSEAGAPCVVRHGIVGPIEVRDERGRRLRWDTADDGAISIRLRKGESGFGPAPDAEAEVRV
ncbi:glycoside hydrolase family 95-like protein [Streptomyces lunaelactis]|uniref:glycoside hydrolase family 95-like protein n=1 Tax=Streptomyces lunaelactis TaxID=1535768 RepID=UPI0035A0829F